jgi:hypothetical protein
VTYEVTIYRAALLDWRWQTTAGAGCTLTRKGARRAAKRHIRRHERMLSKPNRSPIIETFAVTTTRPENHPAPTQGEPS